ncbi:hypothetical protein [Lentimicrobium sp.]|uniref:hypothetical protein n=1 Tax=Lentimicrobium sp. TaxID=2034841 RepID=UPI00345E8AD7
MPYIEIQNEDPELRKQLADFVIGFATIERYISDLSFRIAFFEGNNPSYLSIAKKDLSEKRKIIKSFIKHNLPNLFDQWSNINNAIGDLNSERKILIHSISIFNVTSNYFDSGIRHNNQFKTYTAKEIQELNERIDELNFGEGGIGTRFYKELTDGLEQLNKANT